MPAFLLEGGAFKKWVKRNIAVDIHDVEIFGPVAGGKWIHGGIRAGHGIQKGHQAALVDFAEYIFDRIFFGTHQDRMLKDMSNTGGIFRHGLEGYAKRLVDIGILDCKGRGA